MEENTDNKIEFKNRLIFFYKENKFKFYLVLIFILLIIISISIFNIYKEKKNNLIAEKFIQAGINLSNDNLEISQKIFEEIIYSGNKFYAMLSLNTILDKNLVKDNSKILEYFDKVEKINKSNENTDIIMFKKALYLIKIGNQEEGKKLLSVLSKKESSKYKKIAKEIISN
tara:strand:+ start:68 stop:580 length:513 start_codon:yes stop_codon:yes gene_type:complete